MNKSVVIVIAFLAVLFFGCVFSLIISKIYMVPQMSLLGAAFTFGLALWLSVLNYLDLARGFLKASLLLHAATIGSCFFLWDNAAIWILASVVTLTNIAIVVVLRQVIGPLR